MNAPRNGAIGVIGAITSSLKDSPGLLVVATLNVIILLALFWNARELNLRRDANLQLILERCLAPKT